MKERFLFILLVLRFDDAADRKQRKANNPDAASLTVFNKFVRKFKEVLYSGGICMFR